MSAYSIGVLVDKMTSPDKDFRFMAINDLMKELAGGVNLEEDSVVKIIRSLLKLLNDNIGEIQNLAIKCIGSLAQPGKIKQHQLDFIFDSLTPFIFDKNDTTRDIHAMALKSVISSVASLTTNAQTAHTIKKLIVKLCEKLRDPTLDEAARIDVIDILDELLLRFGDSVSDQHILIHTVICEQLHSSRPAVKKRTTSAYGKLAGVASSALYDDMVSGLLQRLGTAKGPQACRTLVVALTAVAKSGGAKFSIHLSKVVPYLIQFLRSSDDDDLKEAALQGLDVFLYRCPNEVAAFQTDVQQVLSAGLRHDPNYEYGNDEDEEEMDMEDDDDYSDDEDVSWKVRRAAAKAIEAMMNSRREALLTYVNVLGPLLITRFKEREESVRNEVLNAYIAMLNQISIVIPDVQSAIVVQNEGDDMISDDVINCGETQLSTLYLSNEQINIFKGLIDQKDRLLKAILKVLKKHLKSGPTCLELLTKLVKTCPGVLDGYLSELIPAVSRILTERSTPANGKLTVLNFITSTFAMHSPKVFDSLQDPIASIIFTAINDNFYKVSSQGLTLSIKFVDVLAHCRNPDKALETIFETVNKKFLANDTDQDVREKSISSVSHMVATFKTKLASQTPAVLEKLVERVTSDMTCLVAIRATTEIIAASIPIEQKFLEQFLARITQYLKKISRSLKIASLTFVEQLLKNSTVNKIPTNEMSQVLHVLPSLINEVDLQVTNQSLSCISHALIQLPAAIEPELEEVIKSVIKLVQSPLLQGTAVSSLHEFFINMIQSNVQNKPSFVQILDSLTSPVYDVQNLPRQAFQTISACTSVIAQSTNDLSKSQTLAKKLCDQFTNHRSNDAIRLFAMNALGELGRRCPEVFESSPDIHPEKLAIEAFNSGVEDLKGCAAHTLGALAVGNLQRYLPFILEHIRSYPKKQYLLLHALKEVIVWEAMEEESTEVFRSAIPDIWEMLLNNAGGQEDGTRTVVAECLGRLCAFDPEVLLPKLKANVTSENPVIRSAIVNSVKYMLNIDKKSTDLALQKHIGDFLFAVTDSDLNVRRTALAVLNSAAHNKPSLIRDLLPKLLPAVYEETSIKKELIREVEMGPFKHLVDDGLDLRKSAFECMYTLLENCVDKIEISEYLSVLEAGLKDTSADIKLLNYLTLQKVAVIAPGQLLQRIDRVCEPLKAQLFARPRSNAVKQELEKLDEMKKSTIRVIFTLKRRLPDVDRQQQFHELVGIIKTSKDLEHITELVIRESQKAVIYDVPMETA